MTRQLGRTVADRNSFRVAMLNAIMGMVEAGAVSESTGLARGGAVNARYVEGRVAETGGHVTAWAAAAAPPKAEFSGARVRRCPKCPTRDDGTPTTHPPNFECKTVVTCVVCNSERHMAHSCYIKNGVPQGSRLNVDLSTELMRLHALVVLNKFDWKSTPTTLMWLNNMRERHRRGTTEVNVSFVAREDERGWDSASQTEFRSQAACEECAEPAQHVAPAMAGTVVRDEARPITSAWPGAQHVAPAMAETVVHDGAREAEQPMASAWPGT